MRRALRTGRLRATFAAAGSLAALSLATAATAQVQLGGRLLPLQLAEDAARHAVAQCAAQGYAVSAAVVDVAGLERVLLRGDHSTVHTRDTAFRKAYTAVTLGPVFGHGSTSQLATQLLATPTGPALSSVPQILLLAGGVVLRSHGEVLAALGVGGAPGGALDEACAQAGVAAVQARLDELASALP